MPKVGVGGTVADNDGVVVVGNGYRRLIELCGAAGVAELTNGD